MARGYYQLGGFQPQIQWFRHDEKRLAQTIAGDKSPLRVAGAPAELILGIKRSGTSHLLLTESQTWDVAKSIRLSVPTARPVSPTEFESLSPIEFWDAEELAKKLGTMKPKAHKGRTPVDNSQTNKQYSAGGADGVHRAAFEHGRLLYQIINGVVDLGKYSLDDDFWKSSLKVCSFAFNTLAIDERDRQERIANPIMLDYGITTVDFPDLDETKGTAHFAFDGNLKMEDSRRLPFRHGVMEVLGNSAIAPRLQAFLEPATDRHPTILLVHSEDISRNVLRNMGVDISAWQSGLKHLLGFVTPQIKNEAGPSRPNDPRRQFVHTQTVPVTESRSAHNSASYRGDYEQRRRRSRSRSRSPSHPHNRSSNRSYPSAPSSRYDHHSRRSPPQSRDPRGIGKRGPEAFAPVYVVDVQQLYRKLMQTDDGSESVASISCQLGLSNEQGHCAGNEAVMLVEIWRSMISGSSIDDQRPFRATLIPLKPESAAAVVSAKHPPAGDSDEERDPNDVVQNVTRSFDEPDSDDYGSSDSGY